MNKGLYILFLSISFGFGYIVSDMQHITQVSATTPHSVKNTKIDEQNNDHLNTITSISAQVTQAHPLTTLSEQQKQQISQLIEPMPQQQINDYLNKAFPQQDFSMIHDKKQFAQRILEELSSKNDEQPLSGQLILALTPIMPRFSENLSQVYQAQELFAHFDTFGKFPADEQIFIRWLNRDTGEILLFTPRKVSSNSSQNWVSVAPNGGWKVGTYDVKVYQMLDTLTPIAQASYKIDSVL